MEQTRSRRERTARDAISSLMASAAFDSARGVWDDMLACAESGEGSHGSRGDAPRWLLVMAWECDERRRQGYAVRVSMQTHAAPVRTPTSGRDRCPPLRLSYPGTSPRIQAFLFALSTIHAACINCSSHRRWTLPLSAVRSLFCVQRSLSHSCASGITPPLQSTCSGGCGTLKVVSGISIEFSRGTGCRSVAVDRPPMQPP